MRSALELLAHLRLAGASVFLEGGRVRVRAEPGVLTPELREELAERKAEIVAFLERGPRSGGGAGLELTPLADRLSAPLSFAQARLWFLQQLDPEDASYHIVQAVRLQGAPDVDALRASLHQLAARHEILRTTYASRDGDPEQRIGEPQLVTLSITDLSDRGEHEPLARARGVVAAEVRRPFALECEPPLRVSLLRLGEDDHVLLTVLHHIAADGWSLAVLNRELAAFYGARLRGEDPSLPELSVQYADYAQAQRRWMRGALLEHHLAYWKGALEGVASQELPTTRPRPRVRTYRGGTETLAWPRGLSLELEQLGRSRGATLFMTLTAAFQVLLQRYGGQDDVVVGCPVSARRRTELEGLVGCFVNLVALRTEMTGDPTFGELLARVRQGVLEAFEHQDLPFERLVEELDRGRNQSRNPLFQVLFALQNSPRAPLALPGLAADPFDTGGPTTRFDLEWHLTETADGLTGEVHYDAELFDSGTVAQMIAHLGVLLEAVVRDPEARISELSLLTDSERRRLLVDWNDTAAPYPEDRCVHQLFEEQAARTPDAVAVACEGTRLTYAQLDRRSEHTARQLRVRGAGPGVLVGLCVERSVDLVVGLLGILKAGAAYVPLDPDFPAERLRTMLDDAGVALLLTRRHAALAPPAVDAALVYVDDEASEPDAPDAPPPDPADATGRAVRPEDLAYVIYTSGSTGRPKGVEITHAAVVNFLSAMAREPGIEARDVLLAVTTVSFDIAALELFLPLSVGARVELATRAVAADGERLQRALRSSGATILQATPATWQMLVHAGWEGDGRLKMLCGGEALTRPLARQLLERGGELWNLYGPTEATIWTAVHRVESAATAGADEEPVTIGRPIANTRAYVLDARLRLVPRGVPGELFVAGVGLARGYLGRPELTAERFVPSPWSEDPPDRLYRTGDLARFDANGLLQFLGRTDHQVKLRGFRIELGEIEVVLAQHPDVLQAVALLREEPDGERRIVAYLHLRDGGDGSGPELAELRDFLRHRLPDYMLPAGFVPLDELPLSPSGKVDRKRLAELSPVEVEPPGERAGPRGPAEEAVAGAFAELLGRERVGVHDDFFELGGHSLLATSLISRIREVFQVDLRLSRVFEAPTVAGLTRHVLDARRTDGGTLLPPIRPVERDGPLPLSFAQRRLWLLEQMGAGDAYHMRLELEWSGPLDTAALERALNAIVARHEALRTRFTTVDGAPAQFIDDERPLELRVVDRGAVLAGDRMRVCREIAEAEVDRPLDLERGWLVHATLVRFGDEEHALILRLHHIVVDGWTFGVLLRELASHYAAFVAGRAPDRPPLPIQVADFAVWQREQLDGDALDAQLAYWKRQLGGELPVLNLPLDRPRPALQTFHGASRRVAVDGELTGALRALCRERGVTLAMLLLAAYQTLLARYSGQDEVVVGAPIAGRTRAELEHLIGFFVNSLVLRTDLSGDPPFTELLQRVQRVSLEAYDHQDLPFERLVDELVPARDPSRTPLFQVVFAVHDHQQAELEAGGASVRILPSEVTSTRYDLELHVFEQRAGLAGELIYNTDLFDAASIEQLARHFERLLAGIVRNPQARLSELPLLDDEERERALVEWNDTAVPDPGGEPLGAGGFHGQIEGQAAARPDAVALVHGDSAVTYGELDRRANQVAHTLCAMGVGPETLVGLCVGRGPERVVGMLGILKSGGAYVPLDPEYPRDRLAFMLEDSGLAVLVTQEGLGECLPPHGAEALYLDRDRALLERAPDSRPPGRTEPSALAYAIYTSGSTGRPKAALLEHRGLCNVAREQARVFGVGPGSRVLQFSSLSFDACTFEVAMALPHGATLFLGERDELHPGPDLLEFLRRQRIEVVTLPPTALAATPLGDLPHLATITVAGEPCPRELVARWAPGRRFFNLYGPTEATIWSTTAELEAGDEPHLGRPIGNAQVLLLDAHQNPVPVGVPGEIHIGGLGLARGYHARPELTAERFVTNPYGDRASERLYRSGDLGRYRRDGTIEFLGRLDDQVKLRGFRIELGEIESVLVQLPAVRQCLALIREDVPGDRRLVAYVVHDADAEPPVDPRVESGTGATWENEHVAQWRALYEQSYAEAPAPEDPTFQAASWNSSYTDRALPAAEMREWVDRTVDSILGTAPRRVLEIGCGTGLLLLRIAPGCVEYHGTDLSGAALDYVRTQWTAMNGEAGRVRLEQRAADDFAGIPVGHFDTVVLNSVAQYFPSGDYLGRVLAGAARALRPGGRIFVGDVRSLPLLRAFHTSVQLHRLHGADDGLDAAQLRQRVQQRMDQEQELAVAPEFFLSLRHRLPRLRQVALEPKPGRYDNELSCFRYDVLLTLDDEPGAEMAHRWLDWSAEELTPDRVRDLLRDEAPQSVGLRNVPNRRTLGATRAAELLWREGGPASARALERALAERADGPSGVDPDDLRELSDELPYTCAVSWWAGRADGSFDVLFRRVATNGRADDRWWGPPLSDAPPSERSRATNQPLRGRLIRELVPQLRQLASEKLPAYMVPSAFVVLDAFPVTPNGKLDRRALPTPGALRLEPADASDAPRTEPEEVLAGIWALTLNLERVGIHENFFELGGDSILSIQVASAARESSLYFSAKDVFLHQTVASLAAAVAASSSPVAALAEQGPVTGDVPLTPIQRWYFEQELAEPQHFNQALLLEPRQPLEARELERGLRHLTAHHDALRSRFRRGADGWVQTVVPGPVEFPLEVHDLSGVPPAERALALEREAARIQSALDLTDGPLARAALFCAAGETGDRLLLVVHHLAVDAVSWQILLQDLARALEQDRAGVLVQLPPKTTSYRSWSQGLHAYAESSAVARQAAHWREQPWGEVVPLPRDGRSGANTCGSTAEVEVELPAERTETLLRDLVGATGIGIEPVLLTALARAVASWTGDECVLLDLEGHGREDVLEGVDVSRTVGWFTTLHPVLLRAAAGADGPAALAAVRQALAAIPDRGFAYGPARHLAADPELAASLRGHPAAEIAFNYLGRLDAVLGAQTDFRLVEAPIGASRGPGNRRAHLLEIGAFVLDGRLRSTWTYSANVHAEQTVRRVAERFVDELVQLADSAGGAAAGLSPAVSAGFGWSEADLADIAAEIEKRS